MTDVIDLIRAKRDGATLTDDEIDWVIDGYTRAAIPDEQMSALLMSIVFRGMSDRELTRWTAAMLASGVTLDLSGIGRPTVDKHSTGGVGDKTSLILAPLIAACGAAMPQLSGRGLGHTGGTLDKMEAIAGLRVNLSADEFRRQLADVGAAICSATDDLVPADRRLYALRDVTGTVESIPLIASSIMSKKIAEGTEALVLDVKTGSGAFLPDMAEAAELAETMVRIGSAHGVATRALLTDMGTPLGRCAGNAVEVAESVEVLRGGGPADLVEVTLALARTMLDLVGIDTDPASVLADGSAYAAWCAMVAAQGGDPEAPLPVPRHSRIVRAPASGTVLELDARQVGIAAWRLGAGRSRKTDSVQAAAGVTWHATVGDEVVAGQPLFELHTDDDARLDPAEQAVAGAAVIGDGPTTARVLVSRMIGPR